MKRIQLSKRILIRHAFSWLGVSVMSNIIVPTQFSLMFLIFKQLSSLVIPIIFYYSISIYISPYLKHNLKLFIVLIFGNFLLFISLFYLVEYGQSVLLESEPFEIPTLNWIVYSTLFYFMISLLAHSFYNNQILIETIENESNKSQVIQKQSISYFKNKFSSNLNLKFLDFCYTQISQKDTESAEAILIYKNMTKQTQKINAFETVTISNEIAYLQDYLKLQSLVGKNVKVNFDFIVDDGEFQILPRLLINFVENAFKYSPSGHLNKPIQIQLEVKNNEVNFSTHNYKTNAAIQKQKSTNKGNTITKQQLDLFYKNNYTLNIIESEYQYSSHLNLKFN